MKRTDFPSFRIALLSLAALILNGCNRSGGAGQPVATPAVPVQVAVAQKQDVPRSVESVGAVQALRAVAVKSQVDGMIAQIHFREGDEVKQGDLLVSLDRRPFENSVRIARADLANARAEAAKATADLERYKHLDQQDAISKEQFALLGTKAETTGALVQAKEAAVANAELLLSYTEIRAPFTGRLGRNQASVGTLITTGSATLNTLVQLDPIYVTFNPSETDLAAIEKARSKGPLKAEVYLPGEDKARTSGEVTFVDNTVDRSTGTIVARATIANADRSLLPGQYVRIRLAVSEQPDALVVPQAALGSSQLGKYVYVVGKDNKVDMRLVSLGPTDGNLVAIDKGISEGDQVISGNLQKIGPGSLVQPLPH